MNKSKFKSVKFKPLNRFLYEENACFWRDVGMYHDIMFEEKFIENNESLFEVEKVEREFEEGKYYWAKVWEWSDWDAVKYSHGVFYFVGVPTGFTPNRLYLIAEKIGK